MAQKNNIRRIRFSDELAELIDQRYMTEHERYKLESYLEAGRSVS